MGENSWMNKVVFFTDLKKQNYCGFYDLNIIVGQDQYYFLENCGRFGYSAHPNFFTTLSKKTALQSVADLIDGTFDGKFNHGFGASVTLWTDRRMLHKCWR